MKKMTSHFSHTLWLSSYSIFSLHILSKASFASSAVSNSISGALHPVSKIAVNTKRSSILVNVFLFKLLSPFYLLSR